MSNPLSSLRRHLAAALLIALLALALPHPAHAQPILRGKMAQPATASSVTWQPVRALLAGPGQNALPSSWSGAAPQLELPWIELLLVP